MGRMTWSNVQQLQLQITFLLRFFFSRDCQATSFCFSHAFWIHSYWGAFTVVIMHQYSTPLLNFYSSRTPCIDLARENLRLVYEW